MTICPRLLSNEKSGAGEPMGGVEDAACAACGWIAIDARATLPRWKSARLPIVTLLSSLFGGL